MSHRMAPTLMILSDLESHRACLES